MPSYSKNQREFLENFNRWLKNEFGGEQLAVAERLGVDKSQISRWVSRENAPPEYVCRLLLKEIGGDRFKKAVGRRVHHLREKVFEISLREFTWVLKLDSVSQLEDIEEGEVELPRQSIEILMREYQVQAAYLDYGDKPLFGDVGHSMDSILTYLEKGFKLHIITAPKGTEDRSWLKCKFVLHRHLEHLPQCFKTSTTGSFQSTGGGLSNIEDAVLALMVYTGIPAINPPPVLIADKQEWEDLHGYSFYRKQILSIARNFDEECHGKLIEIIAAGRKRFYWRQGYEKRPEEPTNNPEPEPPVQSP